MSKDFQSSMSQFMKKSVSRFLKRSYGRVTVVEIIILHEHIRGVRSALAGLPAVIQGIFKLTLYTEMVVVTMYGLAYQASTS
jgi:hypothetical protein